jgi:hypothetical protein
MFFSWAELGCFHAAIGAVELGHGMPEYYLRSGRGRARNGLNYLLVAYQCYLDGSSRLSQAPAGCWRSLSMVPPRSSPRPSESEPMASGLPQTIRALL